jgi:hypothetical protein
MEGERYKEGRTGVLIRGNHKSQARQGSDKRGVKANMIVCAPTKVQCLLWAHGYLSATFYLADSIRSYPSEKFPSSPLHRTRHAHTLTLLRPFRRKSDQSARTTAEKANVGSARDQACASIAES